MATPLDEKLIVGISSSALFNTEEADAIYQKEKLKSFIKHQIDNEDVIFKPGTAFPLIQSMLRLNKLASKEIVEIRILSQNHPSAGLRIMNSVEHYGLGITRAAFVNGTSVSKYLKAFEVGLFLSKNENDVRAAAKKGFAAGFLYATPSQVDVDSEKLRIAFDGDAVLFSDESERVYKESKDLKVFQAHEKAHAKEPMNPGPFAPLLRWLATIQECETIRNPDGSVPIRTALVTARNSPAHERVIRTLRHWGVGVDEMFFMGGRPKPEVLKEFQPHIFFDDQDQHVAGAAAHVPSARVLGTVTDTPKVPETSLTVSLTAIPPSTTPKEAEVECTKKDFEDRARGIFSRYTPLGKRRDRVDAKYRKFITDQINRSPVERAKIIRGLEKYDLSSLTTHDPMLNREDDDDVAKKLEKVVVNAIGPKQTEFGI